MRAARSRKPLVSPAKARRMGTNRNAETGIRMTASPYQPLYQNQYCKGVNTKKDQKSVRWSARAVLIRLTYSRRESTETKANSSMDPAGPIMKEMEKIPIMIHQARIRPCRFAIVTL